VEPADGASSAVDTEGRTEPLRIESGALEAELVSSVTETLGGEKPDDTVAPAAGLQVVCLVIPLG
jgi:hypothetical protein